MMARAVIIVALGLLAALLVVRTAFVDAFAARDPGKVAAVWPGHPSVILTSGLEEVGAAAAAGKAVNAATVQRMLAASAKAPLAPEPYLVRGVKAQIAGQELLAGRAFLEARARDPRSLAARYFLADHYLRTGQTRQGLGEISALARLVPQSLERLAPQLAAYARSPGSAPLVKEMLRDNPQLEPRLLNILATDARDSRLALFLWSGRSGEFDRGWQQQLVSTLVDAGRYREALAAWSRFSPVTARQGELVDPLFKTDALPPFGWSLASGSSGVAEPEGGGRLHILYYGRDNLVLASQLLMLKPGTHRLSMRVVGVSPTAKSLSWTVRCLSSRRQLAAFGLASTKGGSLAADFVVPSSGCTVQRLELAGVAPTLPEQADVTISQLRLERRAAK